VELVAEDVREGYVSAAVAREVYRVALDGKGQVDPVATEALRSAPRDGNKAGGGNGAASEVAWAGQ